MVSGTVQDGLALGKATSYPQQYSPHLLQAIGRAPLRARLGLQQGDALPFRGVDQWMAYELSWLNLKGRPEIAALSIQVPAESPCLVESKSLKLYLNSLNQTRFESRETVLATIEDDLERTLKMPVRLQLLELEWLSAAGVRSAPGLSLDRQDIEIDHYQPAPELLQADRSVSVSESLYSNLLRSCCPVTGQPDWGTLCISYAGPAMNHAALLRYLVSFRNEWAFHEETVERIFLDLLRYCEPHELTVAAYYLRRGGIDISPLRSTSVTDLPWQRMARQ